MTADVQRGRTLSHPLYRPWVSMPCRPHPARVMPLLESTMSAHTVLGRNVIATVTRILKWPES